MKRLILSSLCAATLGVSAFAQETAQTAPAAGVSQADFQVLLERMAQLEAAAKAQPDVNALSARLAELEAANKAQAARIAELEGINRQLADTQSATKDALERQQRDFAAAQEEYRRDLVALKAVQEASARDIAAARSEAKADIAATTEAYKKDIAEATALKFDDKSQVSESGRIVTTETGKQYFLADVSARIFEPLSESGLQITPYGYLVFEGIHNTKGAESDYYTDWVRPKGHSGRGHTTVLSMQDSILGLQFDTPEAVNGWKFTGRAEMDLAGDHANDYAFHWRHLYVDAQHESGWSILFGQTWHLWKMVTPSEIDGAWMEQTGHPYRRSPQIRVTKKWDLDDASSLELRAGLVKNGPGMGGDHDDDHNQDNSASAWCLAEAAAIYERDVPWDEKGSGKRWLIGLAGMYGREKCHNDIGKDEEYDSQMVMVAGKVPFGDFTLTGQFFAGEGLAGIQAGCGQDVFSKADGHLQSVQTVGGFIDLNWAFNDKWSFAVGYGFDNPNDSDARNSEGIAFNDRAYFDIFYQITSNFKLGFEYARLTTRYNSGVYNSDYAEKGGHSGTAHADRFQFAAFYDF